MSTLHVGTPAHVYTEHDDTLVVSTDPTWEAGPVAVLQVMPKDAPAQRFFVTAAVAEDLGRRLLEAARVRQTHLKAGD